VVRGPGGHALTDFWEEKDYLQSLFLMLCSFWIKESEQWSPGVFMFIEVFGVSTRGPGHRPFGEKF
jgi:hypothetical protein